MCIMKIAKFYIDGEFKAKKHCLKQVKKEAWSRDIVDKM